MDITTTVYNAANLFSFAMVLVNSILCFALLGIILNVIKTGLELYDYFRARRKISRGYGARRLIALAALDKDGDDNEKAR